MSGLAVVALGGNALVRDKAHQSIPRPVRHGHLGRPAPGRPDRSGLEPRHHPRQRPTGGFHPASLRARRRRGGSRYRSTTPSATPRAPSDTCSSRRWATNCISWHRQTGRGAGDPDGGGARRSRIHPSREARWSIHGRSHRRDDSPANSVGRSSRMPAADGDARSPSPLPVEIVELPVVRALCGRGGGGGRRRWRWGPGRPRSRRCTRRCGSRGGQGPRVGSTGGRARCRPADHHDWRRGGRASTSGRRNSSGSPISPIARGNVRWPQEGQFGEGSMRPKVEALVRLREASSRRRRSHYVTRQSERRLATNERHLDRGRGSPRDRDMSDTTTAPISTARVFKLPVLPAVADGRVPFWRIVLADVPSAASRQTRSPV